MPTHKFYLLNTNLKYYQANLQVQASISLAKKSFFLYTLCLMDDLFPLQQQAISAALSANWQEALNLNQKILDISPENVEALNRAARASFELGNLPQAKKFYEKALKTDPYNQIAIKFLKRIDMCNKKGVKRDVCSESDQLTKNCYQSLKDLFIEEPGKTRVVNLLKVAEPQKLSYLSSGEIVTLVPKNRTVAATDQSGHYLGVLPDDLSHRLIKFIHGGNKYQALIKNIKSNSITLLVRETFRSSRFKNQPSFLDSISEAFIYSSDHIIVPDDGDESGESEPDFNEEETH